MVNFLKKLNRRQSRLSRKSLTIMMLDAMILTSCSTFTHFLSQSRFRKLRTPRELARVQLQWQQQAGEQDNEAKTQIQRAQIKDRHSDR